MMKYCEKTFNISRDQALMKRIFENNRKSRLPYPFAFVLETKSRKPQMVNEILVKFLLAEKIKAHAKELTENCLLFAVACSR